jgi:hypothetical protein
VRALTTEPLRDGGPPSSPSSEYERGDGCGERRIITMLHRYIERLQDELAGTFARELLVMQATAEQCRPGSSPSTRSRP